MENEPESRFVTGRDINFLKARGVTCARRLAGAQRTAPPASSDPSRFDRRPRRSRSRFPGFSRLLTALAALAGALTLFAAAPEPAQAQFVPPPDTPQNVKVTVGNAKLTLTWQAPSSWGSGSAIGYQVDWFSGPAAPAHTSAEWQRVVYNQQFEASATETSFTFSGNVYSRVHDGTNWERGHHSVANGNQYHLRLRAASTKPGDNTDILVSDWVTVSGTPQGTQQTWSTNANLSALTVGSATSSGDQYTDFSIGTFGATVASYTASVANDQTHVKVTPTVADTGATVGVRKGTSGNFDSVTSGQASGAIALDVGANTLVVRVTAEDGSTKDYTVTVTRRQAQQTWSTNANLSALTTGSATSSGGQYTDFSIGTFGATVTSYTASVANDQTHVKVTPTVADTGATVGVRKGTSGNFDSVTSGQASAAIALDVGANTLVVRVTAEDGSTKDYTVTVTRRQAQQARSTNANLSALTASTSTSSGGTFNGLTLTPSSFSASRTSYTASVSNTQTYLKLTPTVADTGKATVTVQGTSVTSGTESGEILLSVGSNTLTVRVMAEDGSTVKDYTVTVTRRAAQQARSTNANLSALTASTSTSSGGTFNGLTLTPSSFSASRTSYTASVSNTQTYLKLTPTVADTGKATVGVRKGSGGSFMPVTSGSASGAFALDVGANPITVRVTAEDGSTTKDYSVAVTRQAQQGPAPTVMLSAAPNPVDEGSSVTVTATLSAALSSQVTIPLTIADDTAEPEDHGTLTGIAIASGATSGTGTITTAQDADTEDETFTVALDAANLPAGLRAGVPASVEVTIREGEVPADTSTNGVAPDPRRGAVQDAVKRALAASARRAMSSALENIGARFGDIGASGLSLAGRWVPLEGGAAKAALYGGGGSGFCAAAGSPGCAAGWSRSMTAGELLGASAFSLHLGASEGAENANGAVPPGPLWSVWGRGDLGTFEGRGDPGLGYDGKLRTGWVGFDARAGTWVAGLAVSHGAGEADYAFADDGLPGGRLETELTSFYPYGRWTLGDGLELRTVAGAGWGEAEHGPAGAARESGDLTMRMASLGVRRALADVGGMEIALRADGSVTRIGTDGGPDAIHGLTADGWRLRAGVEASRRLALRGGRILEPFLEAAVRRDGGDGLEGSGVELAGGVRYVAPGVSVEARGRWLAAHSEDGAEETGVSVTARAGPGSDGRGLFVALSPRWGAGTGGAVALWGAGLPRPSGSGGGGVLDARVGYGIALRDGAGLLTPFAEAGLGDGESRRLRLGTGFERRRTGLRLEVAGERREDASAEPEHALRLDLGLRF